MAAAGDAQHCGQAEASSSEAPMAGAAPEPSTDAGKTAPGASAGAAVPEPTALSGGAAAASAGSPAEAEPMADSQPSADQNAAAAPAGPAQRPSAHTAAAAEPEQPVQGPLPAPASSSPTRQRAAAAAAPHQPVGNVVIQTDEDAIRELRARQVTLQPLHSLPRTAFTIICLLGKLACNHMPRFSGGLHDDALCFTSSSCRA